MKKITLASLVLFSFGMTSLAQAQLVYEATPANTTLFTNAGANNNVIGTDEDFTLSGATPDLLMVNGGGNFFFGGFTSTDNVDTLNGTPVLDTDTVTVEFVVDSVTHTEDSELRSRGIEVGLSADTTLAGGGSLENLTLRIGGNAADQRFFDVALVNNTDGIPYTITSSPNWTATEESVADGFSVTLVANAAGFTFSFTGLDALPDQTVADYTGTWAAPGDFLINVGGGHLYTGVQKRNTGITTVDYSVASISVADTPSSSLGDFDLNGTVDCADLDGYVGNIGEAADGALAVLDFDGNGTLEASDATTHIETLVVTSNGMVGTFPGDLNCDGQVNVLGDAFALVGNLGNMNATSYSQGDINFDGQVNVLGDAFALVGNLGMTNE